MEQEQDQSAPQPRPTRPRRVRARHARSHRLHHPPVPATPGCTTPVTALCGEQHLDDPAADARFEALLTVPALRTFLAPRMATHGLTSVRGYFRDLTAALDRIQ